MNDMWAELKDWQLRQLGVPTPSGRVLALLQEDGEVAVAGQLLMQGPDNYWLVMPVLGYPQYIQGIPAEGGIVPEELNTFLEYDSREKRLEDADLLINNLPPVKGLGDFETFTKCTTCLGYKIQRIFVSSEDLFPTDSNGVVDLRNAQGLIAFIRPGGGLCHCS